MEVVILHTNDTHGRLRPPVTDHLRELRESHPGSLLLDAGDAVTAGNLGFRPGGEAVLERMSELGYAAMCVGNRETHPRKEIFPLKVGRARFPVLCANAVAKGAAPLPVRPHVVLSHEGLGIGVFGVTVPMFTRKQWSQPVCDYWFADPVETARQQAAELRPRVDLLIALTHVGLARDRELAESCPEIDLIIGGHSHTDLDEPAWVGPVPIVHAGAYGRYAGLSALRVGGDGPRLARWEKLPLRGDIPSRSLVII